jgi:hypothetical protein
VEKLVLEKLYKGGKEVFYNDMIENLYITEELAARKWEEEREREGRQTVDTIDDGCDSDLLNEN